jgi:hypothetical protein
MLADADKFAIAMLKRIAQAAAIVPTRASMAFQSESPAASYQDR